MALLLQVDGLTKSVGHRMLFSDLTFSISEGDKLGLVARNGTGKTSLMRILAGEDTPDSGTITATRNLRIGYLPQIPRLSHPGILDSCRELVLRAGGDVHAPDFDDTMARMLHQTGITDLRAPTDTLSGGQRKRIALAALFLAEPDIYLLDEPTNHLDIEVIDWLEKRLSAKRLTLIMVTHDRYFLDRVTDRILEIDMARGWMYEGNYDYFLRRRAERRQAMADELSRVRNTLRREQEWYNSTPQARSGKARYRIDAYHDLKQRSTLRLDEKDVRLEVQSSYIGKKIFEARNVSKRFGDKVILRDFNYTFSRYEKIGIVGENGVGKSTFVKMLQGMIPPDEGRFDVGQTVRFGYYSQEGLQLPGDKQVIDAVRDLAEEVVVNGSMRYTPMQFLTRFLFTPADQQKLIGSLSGGELARLHLATVLMRSPNFLILDEPTNDLDLATLTILEDYLADFEGCVIVISHDRYFLDTIADHLFVMEGDGRVRDFPGIYSEYREQQAQRQRELRRQQRPAEPRTEKVKTAGKPKRTWAEQREFEALTTEIEQLEQEKKALEAIFSGQTENNDAAALAEASMRFSEITELLDMKELRWLELAEKI